jgi:hypothetical protein
MMVAEGGVVAAEIQLSGTPVDEWRGYRPTGAAFVWETCSFYDLDDDREHRLAPSSPSREHLKRTIDVAVAVVEVG